MTKFYIISWAVIYVTTFLVSGLLTNMSAPNRHLVSAIASLIIIFAVEWAFGRKLREWLETDNY